MTPGHGDLFLHPSLQYGIVIDSGSSRSNVYLYEWPGEKQNQTGVVTERMNCRVAGEPNAALLCHRKTCDDCIYVVDGRGCATAGILVHACSNKKTHVHVRARANVSSYYYSRSSKLQS